MDERLTVAARSVLQVVRARYCVCQGEPWIDIIERRLTAGTTARYAHQYQVEDCEALDEIEDGVGPLSRLGTIEVQQNSGASAWQ